MLRVEMGGTTERKFGKVVEWLSHDEGKGKIFNFCLMLDSSRGSKDIEVTWELNPEDGSSATSLDAGCL